MSENNGPSAAELAEMVDADEAELDDRIESTLSELDVSGATGDDAADAASVPSFGDGPDETETQDDDNDGTSDEETVSVLEFVLGDERYCLDISFIEQIVERGTVTRIPNAPPFVEGVIDLRGDITTVIDPKETLAAEEEGNGDLIVVFDPGQMDDEWNVGWAVDGVRRVSTVSLAEVKESPVDEPWINGVVKRDEDGEFVIWTEPGELMRSDARD
ncbi:chemotaxis protein CheW [Haloplanus ruber]|uniref:Chemotaxis protein CheW n=1 Tax=Haloplanus ruber TaxID=869892 RepID=A0ABD6D317_9EURY|nr:chemotaxis protein CheW [Haloplanus ruber]